MKIYFDEIVPELKIFNDNTKCLLIKVSHDDETFSELNPLDVGVLRTYYKIKTIEVTEELKLY